jgi:nicotinate-nucleotide adenylyltransferase
MIIVYGGAFNPPTKAHYLIAQILKEKYNPDKLYFLPVGDVYEKKGLIPFKHRYEMVKILASKINCFVSDEEDTQVYRGTYFSLLPFMEEDKDIYFVMGTDNLLKLEKWSHHIELIKTFKIIVVTRFGFDPTSVIEEKFGEYKDKFTVLKVNYPISSTLFRQTLNPDYLIEDIYDYIRENKLYGVE